MRTGRTVTSSGLREAKERALHELVDVYGLIEGQIETPRIGHLFAVLSCVFF
jgi:hypothetical protein